MKHFWIKERHNPQLGVYYVAYGQLTKVEARKQEKPLYGDNVMHEFETQAAYDERLEELRKEGHKIQKY